MASKVRLPISLKNDPIVTAVFEMRFQSGIEGLADILPGFLFSQFRDRYSKVSGLPLSEIPRPMRMQMPNYRYTPLKQLSGRSANINFGELSVSVEMLRPYPGWGEFRKLISEVTRQIGQTRMIDGVDRISLRYTNLLEKSAGLGGLGAVNVAVNLGGMAVNEGGFHLRAETHSPDGGTLTIIQVTPEANIKLTNHDQIVDLQGLLLDVDCIQTNIVDFWEHHEKMIDRVHEEGKKVFFSLLTAATLEKLGPVWGEQ